MEYCEGGDMGALLKRCKRDRDYIAEDVIWKIFSQIVFALSECHNRKNGKILHRDLKPANIFLDSQNNIKLGDFGLSRIMNENSMYAYTHVGTPYYMSPEQINESKYNESSDIWSAGCLLYEIAALKPPFEAQNHLSLAIKIKAGKFERLPLRYSEDLQKVIESMLNIKPEKRPTVEDLLNYPTIAIRRKEQELKDKHSYLKQKHEEIKAREEAAATLEAKLKAREEELKKLEEHLNDLEIKLITSRDLDSKAIDSQNKENIPPLRIDTNESLQEGQNNTQKIPLPLTKRHVGKCDTYRGITKPTEEQTLYTKFQRQSLEKGSRRSMTSLHSLKEDGVKMPHKKALGDLTNILK